MELKMAKPPAYLRTLFDKYKYVLLLAAVGLLLLLWPTGGVEEGTAADVQPNDAALLAQQLEQVFADIEGVGRVRVLLTVQSGSETVLARDESRTASKSDGTASSSSTVTVVTAGGGEPVVLRTDGPVFSGAVVVCEGAESARVRLSLTEAVRSLTGITADNIVIVKMK